ncbi:ferritin [Patescibacteria group bacterium]|nr:ferritin [Patescibacteria group bacterium]
MGTYEENWEKMSDKSKDLERARQSFIEEFEAINWYEQRIEGTGDPELKKILEHNRDEEKEHAALLFEYVKKNDPEQADALKKSDL